jgi:hypothetical protein
MSSLFDRRKLKAQEEFARLFNRREQLIEALVRVELKLKFVRRRLARYEKKTKGASAVDLVVTGFQEPDLLSDEIEIPGFVRQEHEPC